VERVPSGRHIDGSPNAAGLQGDRVAGDALLVYERVLPALPASITRARTELADTLADHDLAPGRRDDILLVTTEAATNAVLHAYPDSHPGPLYVAATLIDHDLIVCVIDRGRGMRPRSHSPGLGVGLRLMTELADERRIGSDAAGVGTSVQLRFNHATAIRAHDIRPPRSTAAGDRGELLREYLRVLSAATTSLRQDTQAVLAEAEQAVAYARRQQRERARPR
jgi:serine/threonine-protein kinase RsbW/stage II sporulation protein AB (anti-sigma F factor)